MPFLEIRAGASPQEDAVPGAAPRGLAYDLHLPAGAVGDVCVVWCHGFGSSRRSSKADYFSRRFPFSGLAFCAFDFEGHGDSSGTMLEASFSRHIEALGHMLDFLRGEGFRRFVLFGSSMGGGVSAWTATRRPDDVAAAIFIAPGFYLEGGVRRRLGEQGFARWQDEGRVLLEHELGAFELDWRMVEDLRTYDRADLPPIYRTPTLIFQGKRDEDVDWRMVLQFAVDCPADNVQLHLLTDGDHRLAGRLPLLWELSRAFLRERGLWPAAAAANAEDGGPGDD